MSINRGSDKWVVLYMRDDCPAAYVFPIPAFDSDGTPLLATFDYDSAMYHRMDEECKHLALFRPRNAAMMLRSRAEKILKDAGYSDSKGIVSKDLFGDGSNVHNWWSMAIYDASFDRASERERRNAPGK